MSNSKSNDLEIGIKSSDIERGFYFKVYGILTVQLFLNFLLCVIPLVIPSLREAVLRYQVVIIFLALAVLCLALIHLIFDSSLYRRVPYNYILLFFITISLGALMMIACSTEEAATVFTAIIITMFMVCSLSAIAFYIEDNVTFYQGMLVIAANCLVGLIISIFFVNLSVARGMVACICVVIWGVYLLLDLRDAFGKGYIELDCDDYILVALTLYLDIIMLFMKIFEVLKFLSK